MYGYVKDIVEDKGDSVYTTSDTATVRAAVSEMNGKGVGALLVVSGGRPVGIFTERDVLRRVVDSAQDPETTLVRDVMTTELVTIEPTARVEEAMEVMTEKRCRHLPVIEGGNVIGMVSIGDLMRRVSIRQESEIQHLVEYIRGT